MVLPRLAAIIEPLRDDLVLRLVTATLQAPGHRSAGGDPAAVTRLTGQIEAVRKLTSGLLRTARQFAFSVLAALGGVAVLDPMLLVVVLPPVVLSLVLFGLLLPRLAGRQRAVVVAEEGVAGHVTRLLHGVRDVRACQAVDRAVAEAGDVIDTQLTASRRLASMSSNRIVLIALGVHLPLLAILAAAPWLLGAGRVGAGELLAAAAYLTVTVQPALRALIQIGGNWGLQLAVVVSRLATALNVPDPSRRPQLDHSAPHPLRPRGRNLTVRRLGFSYGPRAAAVIDQLELQINEQDHLAVVGPSGAGKSTLADLLAGLLPPTQGTIRLGGLDLARWDPQLLRRTITLIPQEAYLFSGTLRENVLYLNPDLSQAHLTEVADDLHLHPLLDRTGGWDSLVAPHTTNLSTGERQLVALARAYASPSPLIILDEATCHLDPATEAHVEQAFAARGGSLIIIAHRMSSALRAARVLLLDGPRTAIGRHQELLRSSTSYAALYDYWDPQQVDISRPARTASGSDVDR
ncbi:ATP-binding cassette domain-containing protein [Tenggerimyces flavus]|uniref:ATP-binding cassette domain-containing protein n=2 Tax=Tenggerimyces flavus TaxID=1708749 RepID=A0ABV7YFF6_9ACTN